MENSTTFILIMFIIIVIVFAGIIGKYLHKRDFSQSQKFLGYRNPPPPPPPPPLPPHTDFIKSNHINDLLQILLIHYQAQISLSKMSSINNKGLCWAVYVLFIDDIYSLQQSVIILDYIKANRPEDAYPENDNTLNSRYWYPPHETAPRIAWLKKHIQLTCKK